MQTIKEKMIPAFRDANGGLFQAVEKADVGSAYQDLEKQGVALMGWADPFMPDRSLPEPVAAAWLDAVRAESAPHYTAPIGDPALKAALPFADFSPEWQALRYALRENVTLRFFDSDRISPPSQVHTDKPDIVRRYFYVGKKQTVRTFLK